MPPLPDRRNDMKETKYKIETTENSYIITVRISQTSTLIYIGGKYTYCLECQLFNENSFMARIKDITLGELPHVYYQEDCALDKPFLRGDDTKRILYLLISYIQKTYPNIKGLLFTDKSYRECDDKQSVDLAIFYYLLYGKTWYMSTLYADFASIQDKQTFIKAQDSFNNLKQALPWSDFKQFITVKFPIDETELQKMYSITNTWQSFFTTLRNRIGISELCIFVAPWLKSFWNTLFKFNLDSVKFKFMFSDLDVQIEYTLTKYNQNGGRKTRRSK